MLDQLLVFGIFQNKSLVVRVPKNIPDRYTGDFVRGYFDGDGCIYFKSHYAKDRRHYRWVFQTKFISGSLKFLEDLKGLLGRFTKGGFIVKKERGYELFYSHNDSRAIYELMYGKLRGDLFLARKYNKFKNAITILDDKIIAKASHF